MKRLIQNFGFENIPSDSIVIGDDLALISFSNNAINSPKHEPHKLKHAAICICTAGHCTLKINLQTYEIESPMLVTLMPGQIIESIDKSVNFDGHTIVLSKRFIDMLNLPGWQQQYMTLFNNPTNEIPADALRHLQIFYTILHKAASDEENPFRLQVIVNLIRVFYYGGVSKFRKIDNNTTSYKNSIVERFMELVAKHYRDERLIGFYADKLCITPKYLSKLIKDNTGRSAGEWIESHVILEARAMLQSSDMTIQQIAASLNFPNQSFFGKYFKRATGLSPMQYRSKA
jgi:AraC-like DNA-binding protein